MVVLDPQVERDLQLIGMRYAVAACQEELAGDPSVTAAGLVDRLRVRLVDLERSPVAALTGVPCVRCARPVREVGGQLVHLTPAGGVSNRGCRAASFDWSGGTAWDDVPRWWVATV